ncbi:MAG: hypothetical protein K8S25_03095 [Alphaproteobacteria bacterium]|nr:hypothetical protein [Alphaproteobacteria bacterium]
MLRRLTLACAALCLLAATAQAADIKTGRELVDACRAYAALDISQDNNLARQPHPCRTFLQGFFTSLLHAENARRDAMLKGLPYASNELCVRMPDFLSYRDMAGRLVNFGQNNPAVLNGPATTLAQKTLERDFPCPAQPKPH